MNAGTYRIRKYQIPWGWTHRQLDAGTKHQSFAEAACVLLAEPSLQPVAVHLTVGPVLFPILAKLKGVRVSCPDRSPRGCPLAVSGYTSGNSRDQATQCRFGLNEGKGEIAT